MAQLTNGTSWNTTYEQNDSSKTYTFSTLGQYLTKNIELTVKADVIKTVSSVPTTKDTSIIYNSTDSNYYLWR